MSTPNPHPSITDPIGWKLACAAMGTEDGFHEVENQLNEQLGRAGAVLRALRRLDDIVDDSLQDRAYLVDLALCAVDEIDQDIVHVGVAGTVNLLMIETQQRFYEVHRRGAALEEVAHALAVAATLGSGKEALDDQAKILWAHTVIGLASDAHWRAFVDAVAAHGLEVLMVTLLVDEVPHVVESEEAKDLVRRGVAKRARGSVTKKARRPQKALSAPGVKA